MPPTTKPPAGPPPKPVELAQLEEISAAIDAGLAQVETLDPVAPGEALAIIAVSVVKALAPMLRAELATQQAAHAARVAAYERAREAEHVRRSTAEDPR